MVNYWIGFEKYCRPKSHEYWKVEHVFWCIVYGYLETEKINGKKCDCVCKLLHVCKRRIIKLKAKCDEQIWEKPLRYLEDICATMEIYEGSGPSLIVYTFLRTDHGSAAERGMFFLHITVLVCLLLTKDTKGFCFKRSRDWNLQISYTPPTPVRHNIQGTVQWSEQLSIYRVAWNTIT